MTHTEAKAWIGGGVKSYGGQSSGARHPNRAKLLAVDGHPALIRPAGHDRNEWVHLDDIVQWRSRPPHPAARRS